MNLFDVLGLLSFVGDSFGLVYMVLIEFILLSTVVGGLLLDINVVMGSCMALVFWL